MNNFFETNIEFLKGVGPQKAEIMQKELQIFTFGDLIQYYPFRWEDRSKIYQIKDAHEDLAYIQVKGVLTMVSLVGTDTKKRLVAQLEDKTGVIELVWFQSVPFIQKFLKKGDQYIVFGKPNIFNGTINIVHPEIELFGENKSMEGYLQPIYSSTEKLRRFYLDSKGISKLQRQLLELALNKINETLPKYIIDKYKLVSKQKALEQIHFPDSPSTLTQAQRRLKFEELFYIQLKLVKQKHLNKTSFKGLNFNKIPTVNKFYNELLPFELTNAQKRVIKELYADMNTGRQMNRLIQGDVGSGKTMVAFIAMLMAIDNDAQACLMAPTEILAEQHYRGLEEYMQKLGFKIALLTGSSKLSVRREIHQMLEDGHLNVLVGTHAILEDKVQFKNLGLCVIDEQHRFGVAQRSKLWQKNKNVSPHILVMTATPIPRTLAMTLYGDLDISVIDEMPAGRKPIKTVMRTDSQRLTVFGFIRDELNKGRQIYIVYPLIEESAKQDLKDLIDGYESIARAFPDIALSIVHGKMRSKDKDYEMMRFAKNETKIMVATTVIEVGVNVPNASVMIIENAERFGLAQLHQLRGRVGRGAEQSFCVLMTKPNLGAESKVRLETMVRTNNGFEIADVDLHLRGPGDLAGTKQSGALDLLITDLSQDAAILTEARTTAVEIIEKDPEFKLTEHAPIYRHVQSIKHNAVNWARIS